MSCKVRLVAYSRTRLKMNGKQASCLFIRDAIDLLKIKYHAKNCELVHIAQPFLQIEMSRLYHPWSRRLSTHAIKSRSLETGFNKQCWSLTNSLIKLLITFYTWFKNVLPIHRSMFSIVSGILLIRNWDLEIFCWNSFKIWFSQAKKSIWAWVIGR